jgi:ribonuclease-3
MTDERLLSLNRLQEKLAYYFRDAGLLNNALIHRSFVNENLTLCLRDNERLEFLGDSVIGLCTSVILMKQYPDFTEGQLSKMRASIVNEHSLAALAKNHDIGEFLLLGRGEENSGGRMKTSMLSNAFEAVIAAIYLDSGFEEACQFIKRVFEPLIARETGTSIYRDYKTALQEICQNRFKDIPRYTLTAESGPDHDKIFEVSLSVAGIITATGTGKSKKEAEQRAARGALEYLQENEPGDRNGEEETCI